MSWHCRAVAAHFGRTQKSPCLHNLWIPDGMKEAPADRTGFRARLEESWTRSTKPHIRTTRSTIPSRESSSASGARRSSSDRTSSTRVTPSASASFSASTLGIITYDRVGRR
ncbi:MAG: L-rhamnose isomerase [Candidatus Moduliflexus flocculans]|nr:L-rhamnose isomerase [Candidatus Moduliflexus flocculans]